MTPAVKTAGVASEIFGNSSLAPIPTRGRGLHDHFLNEVHCSTNGRLTNRSTCRLGWTNQNGRSWPKATLHDLEETESWCRFYYLLSTFLSTMSIRAIYPYRSHDSDRCDCLHSCLPSPLPARLYAFTDRSHRACALCLSKVPSPADASASVCLLRAAGRGVFCARQLAANYLPMF